MVNFLSERRLLILGGGGGGGGGCWVGGWNWRGCAAPVFDRIPLAKAILVGNIPLGKEDSLIMSPFLHDFKQFQPKYSPFKRNFPKTGGDLNVCIWPLMFMQLRFCVPATTPLIFCWTTSNNYYTTGYSVTSMWQIRGGVRFMMTSSNGNIFRVTGHSPHKGQCAELWCFLWSAPE